MTGELERQNTAQRSELTHFRNDTLHKINMLEDKQKVNMAEFRDAMEGNKSNIDHYLERMEAKFKAMIDKATAGWGDLMVGFRNETFTYITISYNIISYHIASYHNIILYLTISIHIVSYHTVLYRNVWYCIISYHNIISYEKL